MYLCMNKESNNKKIFKKLKLFNNKFYLTIKSLSSNKMLFKNKEKIFKSVITFLEKVSLSHQEIDFL